MYITPEHLTTDLPPLPWSIETKIEVFAQGMDGWLLGIADKCINGRPEECISAIPHSAWAVLQIVLVYFESIAKFQDGFIPLDETQQFSARYFKQGVRSVFPELDNAPAPLIDGLLDALYKRLRCGLYHSGVAAGPILLTRDVDAPLSYRPADGLLIINPHHLVPALRQHFARYADQLRNADNAELRQRFERRWDHLFGDS
jgi:hypothetical protein